MKAFLIALVVVVIAGAGYFWWQNSATPAAPVANNTQQQNDAFGPPAGAVMEDGVIPDTSQGTGGTQTTAPMTASVSYNGTSYSPASVTIKKGGTVTWTSGADMWVASAQHPTHTVYSGTTLQEHCAAGAAKSFDQCARGKSYSFTFDKVGTWAYHDHVNSSARGSVIVVE